MPWPRRVRVGVMEHLERAPGLANRKLEGLTEGTATVCRPGLPRGGLEVGDPAGEEAPLGL